MYFKAVICGLDKYQNGKVKSWEAHFKALRKVCRFEKFQVIAGLYGYQDEINGRLG